MPEHDQLSEPPTAAAGFTPNHERWAEALAVMKRYGDSAHIHIATRIGELARAGDQAGIDRWKSIAVRIDQLKCGPAQ